MHVHRHNIILDSEEMLVEGEYMFLYINCACACTHEKGFYFPL